MSKGKRIPLTEEQIHDLLLDLNESIVKMGLNVRSLEKLLLKKGYLTELEIAEMTQEVDREARAAVQLARTIFQREPPKPQ